MDKMTPEQQKLIEQAAIENTIKNFKLPADKTQSDDTLLTWSSSIDFIRGAQWAIENAEKLGLMKKETLVEILNSFHAGVSGNIKDYTFGKIKTKSNRGQE